MTLSNKKILLLSSIFTFFLTSQAFALPIAGTQVLMENDWEVPYSMKDKDGTVYQTFCLESHNYFTPNTLYWVESLGDYVKGGGKDASDGSDPLSEDTKWLYAAYMSNVFSTEKNAALTVQHAIWYLEGEDGGSLSAWDSLSTYKKTFKASGWNIVAVNLTRDGADNQSQLVGTAPVPEPATMLLFGTGLAGLAGARLRRKKK